MNNRKAFTFIELMIVIAIIGILAAVSVDAFRNVGYADKLKAQGYDMVEVKVFLNGTPYKYRDLYESQALKKQFETFKSGGDPSFMNAARAQQSANEARAAAQSAQSSSYRSW